MKHKYDYCLRNWCTALNKMNKMNWIWMNEYWFGIECYQWNMKSLFQWLIKKLALFKRTFGKVEKFRKVKSLRKRWGFQSYVCIGISVREWNPSGPWKSYQKSEKLLFISRITIKSTEWIDNFGIVTLQSPSLFLSSLLSTK